MAVNAQKKYRFSFWYNGDNQVIDDITETNRDPEFVSHPCGAVHYMEVSSIPDFEGDPSHDTDFAIEYEADGNKIQKWNYPVDQRIMGVADDLLLVEYRGGKLLGIKPDGSIVETNFMSSDEGFGTEKCPAPMEKAFAPSVYLGCSTVKDAKSGTTRSLAFQGPCT